jgi:hypothetical protein
MKITLQELRTMIRESIKETLKEQGPPNPIIDPWSASQGTMTTRPQVPGQTTAPTPTPVQTPAPTGQRQADGQGSPTTNVANAINSIIRRLNVITRKALSATPRGGQPQFLPANVIISDIATMQPILNRLKTNLDIKMLGKERIVNQAIGELESIGRTSPDSASRERLIRKIYTAARLLRQVTRELGSQDAQTDQMISQLAAVSSSPQFAERPGQAPGQLAGSQVVPVGYRPEGAPPQERPVMASAMQERRTRKR